MHRLNILSLLQRYVPSKKEFETKKRFIDFINNYPECFKRELAHGHLTSSAWLINKQGDKALLMKHAKLKIWVQPGGHADGEHNLLKVAIKESQEESGIINIEPVFNDIFDLDIHLIPANIKEQAHYHYDVRFLLQVKSEEDFIPNQESLELRWIPKDINQLPTEEKSVVRLFRKWINLK